MLQPISPVASYLPSSIPNIPATTNVTTPPTFQAPVAQVSDTYLGDLYQDAPYKPFDYGRPNGIVSSFAAFMARPFSKVMNVPFEYVDERGAMQTMEQEAEVWPSAAAWVRDRTFASVGDTPLIDGDLATIQKIIPSVVRFSVESNKEEAWYGSGVIVEPSDIIPGYQPRYGEYFVLTNNHVAEDAKYMSVMLPNGLEIRAEAVETKYRTKMLDKGMDIALTRIVVPYPLPTAKIGDPKTLVPGQVIYTAGYPRALPHISITKGVISNPRQETGALSEDIQSDAPINPGNSGGPSFGQNGEIIGLNTYTFRGGDNLTFTKPIDGQIAALRKLWENGYIIRGSLGFQVKDFSLNEREKAGFPEGMTGAVVSDVPKGSLAEKAGLKKGDVITWMEVRSNGASVKSLFVDIKDGFEAQGVIKRWAADIAPGTKVNLLVWRKESGAYTTYDLEVPVGFMTDAD